MSGSTVIDAGFVLFGVPHALTMLICAGAAVLAHRLGKRLHGTRSAWPVAVAIALAMVAIELLKTWQAISLYGQPWQEMLPLHLCRISSYVCGLMLICRSYRIFEVAYFWGIGGSTAAILTPDLAAAFPHPLFIGFFIGHGLVLCAVLFAVGAFDFRPRLRSIVVTAAVSAVYMAFVALINVALDTNYLYLCAKPENPSPYDYFGPWPWYIVTLWIVGIAVAGLCYLPFARRN